MIGYDGKPIKTGKGDKPRKSNTKKYRSNYELIFGKTPKRKRGTK